MKNFYIVFNKTLITILIFLFVISTNGCESQKLSSETDRFSIASIEEERHINLPEDKVILDGAFYGSLFFYVCRDCSDVFVMDTENGGTEVFARDLDTPVCLAADSDGVFVYDYASNSVLRLDEAGEEHEV